MLYDDVDEDDNESLGAMEARSKRCKQSVFGTDLESHSVHDVDAADDEIGDEQKAPFPYMEDTSLHKASFGSKGEGPLGWVARVLSAFEDELSSKEQIKTLCFATACSGTGCPRLCLEAWLHGCICQKACVH